MTVSRHNAKLWRVFAIKDVLVVYPGAKSPTAWLWAKDLPAFCKKSKVWAFDNSKFLPMYQEINWEA
jgi:hypothetical protein